jgi:hypothetical protein
MGRQRDASPTSRQVWTPFVFESKALTLERLGDKISLMRIPRMTHFTVDEWLDANCNVMAMIRKFGFEAGSPVIVRSSAADEDSRTSSQAGRYLSVPDVDVSDPFTFSAAIDRVVASVHAVRRHAPSDRVIVQEFFDNVAMSGVVFTRDIETASPYYVVNYDDSSGRTDNVTSGRGAYSNRTLWIHRESSDHIASTRFQRLIAGVRELEEITGQDCLDIEFALGTDDQLWLLQVRPLITAAPVSLQLDRRVDSALHTISDFIRDRGGREGDLFGDFSVLGQMPDWNPAEIIGRTPKKLASDLYAYLVTDSSWRLARARMGYRPMAPAPLMHSIAGQPFVDVRRSLNSFLPSGISDGLGERLVNAWLELLSTHPHLHDKVEFEVASTAFRFDLTSFYKRRYPGLLNMTELSEYSELLRAMTLRFVRDEGGSYSAFENELSQLESWQATRTSIPENPGQIWIDLETCRDLGVVPFAGIARHAFIARGLLASLSADGYLPDDFVDRELRGMRTVATEFQEALASSTTHVGASELLGRFGHLRPGTYEINSPTYRTIGLGALPVVSSRSSEPHRDGPTEQSLHLVGRALKLCGATDWDPGELLEYFYKATRERERAKLVFTTTLSSVLEGIAAWGGTLGISREEMGFVRLNVILEQGSRVDEKDSRTIVEQSSLEGRNAHVLTRALRCPALIVDPGDVRIVPILISLPNFVSNKVAQGRVVELHGDESDWRRNLSDAIVLIENADPGFDWIFSRGIGGLITKFGGSNSHMAIRCSEFALPAAIGCGEQLYEVLRIAQAVEVDAVHHVVRPLAE